MYIARMKKDVAPIVWDVQSMSLPSEMVPVERHSMRQHAIESGPKCLTLLSSFPVISKLLIMMKFLPFKRLFTSKSENLYRTTLESPSSQFGRSRIRGTWWLYAWCRFLGRVVRVFCGEPQRKSIVQWLWQGQRRKEGTCGPWSRTCRGCFAGDGIVMVGWVVGMWGSGREFAFIAFDYNLLWLKL